MFRGGKLSEKVENNGIITVICTKDDAEYKITSIMNKNRKYDLVIFQNNKCISIKKNVSTSSRNVNKMILKTSQQFNDTPKQRIDYFNKRQQFLDERHKKNLEEIEKGNPQ